jgi:hypothetical protein
VFEGEECRFATFGGVEIGGCESFEHAEWHHAGPRRHNSSGGSRHTGGSEAKA